ncbi:hypothetical protein CKA55_12120 [Arcobacter suis]|uniref:Uncharacterized protein n=1 Tax=Arcobacter suis CECT 7833 TaxID=663365 RepID=A0AAD0WR86_9BACT|nr:hypothetical protein [Arcobacter suis]AXX90556.1 hypothetical protein ASUIS_2119 [Arcobacter suis CECT 7833]RWS45568.1 hypothetical protein CKA55_12120 [Arcobacter suis]
MKIINNQNLSYSYGINSTSSAQQTNSTNTTNSFDSYLSTSSEESTNKQVSTSINFLEKYNAFDFLSNVDKIQFKEILSDNYIDSFEINNLSYEQIEKLEKLVKPNLSKEEVNQMPIIGMDNAINYIFSTVNITSDKTFNEALSNTYKQIDNEFDRMNFSLEINTNLNQLKNNEDLIARFYSNVISKYYDETKNINIDSNQFLLNITNIHKNAINDEGKSSELKVQHQKTLNYYNLLQDNFTKLTTTKSQYF